MADQFPALLDKHIDFIQQQHLFFVATAGAEGYVNVSPKGMDTLRVLDEQKVIWLNLTGSGNETAAHVLENQRMTLMFCSFDRQPLILRLYGNATVIHADDPAWSERIGLFPSFTGARQLFELELTLVQTSCGYAVPYFEAKGERPTLAKWADNKGRAGIEDYWQAKNTKSLDGKPTGMGSDD
ncbi:MAG: pyridoxamine 5'-phosphate oxidase family protein [Pseudomonadota bacterium]